MLYVIKKELLQFSELGTSFFQVNHASDVWVLGKAEPESYDAMVTNQSGLVLTAPGADCMPILFADPVKKVIGAAHAGRWTVKWTVNNSLRSYLFT